ncbi:MAG: tetratricopeptide repeat protein [Chitinivibrionales bacterium]|nr:tetratricopeptide repeat protein [Chitinivibrionales bacterium]
MGQDDNMEQRVNSGDTVCILCIALVLIFAGCGPSDVDKGNTNLALGDYPAAIGFFTREIQQDPKSYDARVGLGKALLQKAADNNGDTTIWKQALIQLEAARTLNPDDKALKLLSHAWAEYSRLVLAHSDTVRALEALSTALRYDPENIEVVNSIGILYFKLGYAQKSEALFTRAIFLDSTHSNSYFNLGMVYWSQERYTNAHAQWLKALKFKPEDRDILYWFAQAEKKRREGR